MNVRRQLLRISWRKTMRSHYDGVGIRIAPSVSRSKVLRTRLTWIDAEIELMNLKQEPTGGRPAHHTRKHEDGLRRLSRKP